MYHIGALGGGSSSQTKADFSLKGVTNSNEVSPGPPSPSEVTDYSEQATDRESYSIDHYAEETDSGSQLTRFTGMWFVETGREPNGYQDQTRSDTETEAEQSVNPDNE
jgi:hypothetical protein